MDGKDHNQFKRLYYNLMFILEKHITETYNNETLLLSNSFQHTTLWDVLDYIVLPMFNFIWYKWFIILAEITFFA